MTRNKAHTMKILITFTFILTSYIGFAQGGGIEMIQNFGGNGGKNEFHRALKASDQKYFTFFKRTPLDTNKNFNLLGFSPKIEDATVGYKKNFRSRKLDSTLFIGAKELSEDLKFAFINDSLKVLPGQFGFVGNEKINYQCTLNSIDIKFNGKKIKNGKTSFKQLVVKIKVDWKVGDKVFTKEGYYINVSNLKKEALELQPSLYEAFVGAFDKLVSDEKFRSYLDAQ